MSSAKPFCGMIFDKHNDCFLGTAIIYKDMAIDELGSGKSAWVTSKHCVEGHKEVIIWNNKGEEKRGRILQSYVDYGMTYMTCNHIEAPLPLPGVLVKKGDKVYLIGFECSASTPTPELRMRVGDVLEPKTVDLDLIEIDFGEGLFGGNIINAWGFLGGLLVRADGCWIGIITRVVNAKQCLAIPTLTILSFLVKP